MTENKRFTHQRTDYYNFSNILDNGKWVGICHVDYEDDFVNLLNDSSEENEQLKQKIKSIKEILNEDIGYIESLRKIEEVLK